MNPPLKRRPLATRSLQPATWDLPFALLSLLLLAIPALQPLLTDSLTCGYDNIFHLWRAVEVEHLLRQGILFPRWAPDMAHGLGFPLFVFMPYLSATLAALLHLLGLSWPLAVNGIFVLGVVLGGLFMFLLARDLFGLPAAWLAAVAYVYAPFQAYDIFNRGSLSESLAWAWAPLVVWALQRWTVHAERRFLLVGAAGLAAFVLTHHPFAFLFVPLLIGWVALNAVLARGERRAPAQLLLRALAMGALGLGLCAFFWLPALAERGWVQTDRLLGLWVFDYRYNFLSAGDLLALPRSADPLLVNDWPPKALGLVPLLVALLPLLRWRRLGRTVRAQVALLLLLTALFASLTLSPSLPLWERLPLLAYVQFPWRFLGPAAFCLALLAGAAVAPAAQPSEGGTLTPPPPACGGHTPKGAGGGGRATSPTFIWASAALTALLLLSNLGWFYPAHCPAPADTSLAGLIAWERATDTLGTTARGEYLPLWVQQMPPADLLVAAYEDGGPVARLDPASLPDGARVLRAEYGPLRAVVELESPQPFRARYLAFYYPGWQVRVDGKAALVAPSSPEGLLTFDIPAGLHTITVRFAETPLRLLADAISLLSLVVLLLVPFLALFQRRAPFSPCHSVSPAPLLLTALLLVILKMAVIDRVETPLRWSRLREGQLTAVDVPASVAFDGQFRLLGYDALAERVAADGSLEVRLYWQDAIPGGPDYRVELALEGEDGLRWNDPELRVPRWHRAPPSSAAWPADGYALTALEMRPLPGTPPGAYTVTLGVFDRATLAPYAASDAVGQPLGFQVPLGRIEVTRPRRPLTAVDAQHDADVAFGPLRLVGYSLDRAEAAPGDPFLLTLFWRADAAPADDLQAQVRLLDPAGVPRLALDLPPVRADWPTTLWQAGDLWRGQHAFRLPASLEDGTHRWEVVLYRDGVVGQSFELGTLLVHAPEHLWVAPPLDVEANARFGNVITLLGAQLACDLQGATCNLQPGTILTVTLAWQAEAEMETSYRVFLHLAGAEGGLVAQSDGEPVDWTRPTTGWLPGEVVLDERTLVVSEEVPPGEYELWVGVYRWPSLERLPAFHADGSPWPDDRVLLAEITLVAAP